MEERVACLLERAAEVAAIDDALAAARAGRGAMVLVEGPAGIGKTELLSAALIRARRNDMRVLAACGGELEVSIPFAVVRQLFEPALLRADGATRERVLSGAAVHAAGVVDPRVDPGASAVDPAAVLHGLYWLTANLCADAPLVLVVDDMHWSDPGSASWLVYLARRAEGLALTLLLAARPVEPGVDHRLLGQFRAIDGLTRLRPAPLSPAAIEELARSHLGRAVDASFTAACHSATAGNPFYVTELLRALRSDHVAGAEPGSRAIEGLTPAAVVEATLARLARMPAEVRRVAEAVALLEPSAELRWVADLTGLADDVVASSADALLAVGIMRSVTPCHFAHPIIRSAVEREILPARRGRMRRDAAGALARAGMPMDAVAAHLLQAPPAGDPWVVSIMSRAATQANSTGAPASAVTYLERALAEPAAPEERLDLLLALGKTESQLQRPQAAGHLREALALAEHPDQAATVALWLGQALWHAGAFGEACDVLVDVLARLGDHESPTLVELQAYLLSIAVLAGRMRATEPHAATLEARTPEGSPLVAAVQATLAFRELIAGQARGGVLARARRAAQASAAAPRSTHAHSSQRQAPAMTLVWIDELDAAEQGLSRLIKAASADGRRQSFEIFSALRGYTMHRRGDLAEAAADIEPILAAEPQREGLNIAQLVALLTRVCLMVETGRAHEAEAIAKSANIPRASEHTPFVAMLRYGEGIAQLAQAKFGDAQTTLERVGSVCEAGWIRSPVVVPWRSGLALALAGTARHDEGVELAREELRLAEGCDVNRARGLALRALGLLVGGTEGLEHLEASVLAFARSPARLELGWASYELGAALSRANRRRDARAPLDRALDQALTSGAELLATRASEQLQALGARPRSVLLTGTDSLTPSERRVCRLATEGLKNAEIAQALFVSLKTVETHLRSSYRKLDISSRGDLPRTLGAVR